MQRRATQRKEPDRAGNEKQNSGACRTSMSWSRSKRPSHCTSRLRFAEQRLRLRNFVQQTGQRERSPTGARGEGARALSWSTAAGSDGQPYPSSPTNAHSSSGGALILTQLIVGLAMWVRGGATRCGTWMRGEHRCAVSITTRAATAVDDGRHLYGHGTDLLHSHRTFGLVRPGSSGGDLSATPTSFWSAYMGCRICASTGVPIDVVPLKSLPHLSSCPTAGCKYMYPAMSNLGQSTAEGLFFAPTSTCLVNGPSQTDSPSYHRRDARHVAIFFLGTLVLLPSLVS